MKVLLRGHSSIRGVAALLIALALGGCGERAKTAAFAPPQMPPTPVNAVPVVMEDIPIYADEIGKCVSPEIVAIQSQVSGKILEVHFREGSEVKKGDKLFTIDPRLFQAQLDQAVADNELNKSAVEQSVAAVGAYRAQVEEAKAVLAQSRSRLELYQLEFERFKALVAADAATQQDLDNKALQLKTGRDQIVADQASIARAEAQIRQGEATVSMSRAKIGSGDAMIATAKINLGYTVVLSPIDGRAGQRMADAGNIVNANMMMSNSVPLVTVQRMDPLFVDFTIPERDLPRARESFKAGTLIAQCRGSAAEDKEREGKVEFIDSAVQDGTGTVKLRASLVNADRAFWPGQFVTVRLVFGTRAKTPLVPSSAPQIGQTGAFVYVVKSDDTIEMRPVKLGQKFGERVAIVEGLKGDESVVTAGQMMLYPGAKVAPQAPEKTAQGGAK